MPGIVTFKVSHRIGRHPRTGDIIQVPDWHTITYRPVHALRSAVQELFL
ncbi:HU family DNA-binding protein [Gilvimarinus sp. 2_MG-2023]